MISVSGKAIILHSGFMGHSKRIKYFIVHHLGISYREADDLFNEQLVLVDGEPAPPELELNKNSEIRVGEKVLRQKPDFKYFLFYKPVGIESTLNPGIENNLLNFIPDDLDLHPAGRLDKYSEGLMLLTNDGYLTQHIIQDGVEKEYEVEVDSVIGSEFKNKMEGGVEILKTITKPCKVTISGERSFQIILQQGLNRQIRRMCARCGCEVVRLKRTRIGKYKLENLQPGEFVEVKKLVS